MLAVEAMKCAFRKTMKSCVIFSSDGDLIPLIKALVDEGVTVTVISFQNPIKGRVGPELRNNSDFFHQVHGFDILRCMEANFTCAKTLLPEEDLYKLPSGPVLTFKDTRSETRLSEDGKVIIEVPVKPYMVDGKGRKTDYHLHYNNEESAIFHHSLIGPIDPNDLT